MEYKVGDRVRIKTNLTEYESDRCAVTGAMVGMEGQVHIIEEISCINHNYKIFTNSGDDYWWFSEEMLEPVTPTLAEIKEKKLRCVIKVDSKKEAIKLFEIFNSNGYDANYAYDYLMVNYWKGDGTVCFSVVGNKINGFDAETYYEEDEEQYGKIYRFKDLFAEGGVATLKPRDTSMSFDAPYLDLSCFILPTNSREFEEKFNEELAKHFNAFSNDGISAKNGGKNSMKFTFYTEEGYRIDKSNNTRIPTMTTEVLINGKDYQYSGSATCDKTDYEEREGVLNAIANAVCGGNFDREFNKVMKNKAFADKKSRTCTYCGQLFDTVEEKREHEAWHVECKKARRERYLLRKRAKKIAFEEQAQKMAKEMMK